MNSAAPLLQALITDYDDSDVWAIGVITYFLLCGYTPFDRDSNLEEMQAILVADYSFTPLEYWRGVSGHARQFIRRCLTVDSAARITAHEALQHPWIVSGGRSEGGAGKDLLPTVKRNFNARRTLHAAIDTIRAINKLREGGAAAFMNGALSKQPATAKADADASAEQLAGKSGVGASEKADGAAGEMTGVAGQARQEEGEKSAGAAGLTTAQGGSAMDVDSRGHGKGQTDDMIRAHEEKIKATMGGLWNPGQVRVSQR